MKQWMVIQRPKRGMEHRGTLWLVVEAKSKAAAVRAAYEGLGNDLTHWTRPQAYPFTLWHIYTNHR